MVLVASVIGFAARAHFYSAVEDASRMPSGLDHSAEDIVRDLLGSGTTANACVLSKGRSTSYNPASDRLLLLEGSGDRYDVAALALGLHEAGHATCCCKHPFIKGLLPAARIVRGLVSIAWLFALVLTLAHALGAGAPSVVIVVLACYAAVVSCGVILCILEATASLWAARIMRDSLQLGCNQMRKARSLLCSAFIVYVLEAFAIHSAFIRPSSPSH